jgi:hypothetical protein
MILKKRFGSPEDLEQALRQNLKLRRQLGAAVSKAKRESGRGRPGATIGRAQTASNDLEQLRRELSRRRSINAAAAAKRDEDYQAEEPRAPERTDGSLAGRVIWQASIVLGLACLGLAALMAVWMVYA